MNKQFRLQELAAFVTLMVPGESAVLPQAIVLALRPEGFEKPSCVLHLCFGIKRNNVLLVAKHFWRWKVFFGGRKRLFG